MNKVIVSGRLTKDPESRQAGETALATFSLAVDRKYKRQGESDADFFDCVSFGKTAEFATKHLTKGTKIIATGRLKNNEYTARDGSKRRNTQIIVEDVEFAESKKKTAETGAESVREASPSDGFMHIPDSMSDEDLPFG